jgi:hypothetical protein
VSSDTIVELPVLCTSSSPTSNDCLIGGGPAAGELLDELPVGNLEDSWSVLRSDCVLLAM